MEFHETDILHKKKKANKNPPNAPPGEFWYYKYLEGFYVFISYE